MKTKLRMNLGNRGLLPEEVGLIERVNAALQASAARHGITLKPSARLVLHTSYLNGHPVYRAAGAGQAPVDVPLAPGSEGFGTP
jgi:hypothetical protein